MGKIYQFILLGLAMLLSSYSNSWAQGSTTAWMTGKSPIMKVKGCQEQRFRPYTRQPARSMVSLPGQMGVMISPT